MLFTNNIYKFGKALYTFEDVSAGTHSLQDIQTNRKTWLVVCQRVYSEMTCAIIQVFVHYDRLRSKAIWTKGFLWWGWTHPSPHNTQHPTPHPAPPHPPSFPVSLAACPVRWQNLSTLLMRKNRDGVRRRSYRLGIFPFSKVFLKCSRWRAGRRWTW